MTLFQKKEKAKQQSHMNWVLKMIEDGQEAHLPTRNVAATKHAASSKRECVSERERANERECVRIWLHCMLPIKRLLLAGGSVRENERETERVCVCVCVWISLRATLLPRNTLPSASVGERDRERQRKGERGCVCVCVC